jgi:hypothetical protein
MTFLSTFRRALAGVARNAVRSPVLNLGVLLAFGVLLPKRYGIDFLDIRMILSYSFIPMLFVAPAVTAALREGSPVRESTVELFACVSAIMTYGWIVGLAVMALGLATINYIYRPPDLLLPSSGVLPAYLVFSFAAVVFVAAVGAYIALLFSPRASLNTLRFGFVALLFFFYGGTAWLPVSWQVALASAFTTDGFMRSAIVASAALLVFAGGLLGAIGSRGSTG